MKPKANEPAPLAGVFLFRAAQFMKTRPGMLGNLLAQRQDSRGETEGDQCSILACDRDTYYHLALCLAPRAERWDEDIAETAAHYGIEAGALEELLQDYRPVRFCGHCGNGIPCDCHIQLPD